MKYQKIYSLYYIFWLYLKISKEYAWESLINDNIYVYQLFIFAVILVFLYAIIVYFAIFGKRKFEMFMNFFYFYLTNGWTQMDHGFT